MGKAVNLALDMLENRRQDYKNVGVQYYHPWLVLMTDGRPNGSAYELARASSRSRDLVTRNNLVVFPIKPMRQSTAFPTDGRWGSIPA